MPRASRSSLPRALLPCQALGGRELDYVIVSYCLIYVAKTPGHPQHEAVRSQLSSGFDQRDRLDASSESAVTAQLDRCVLDAVRAATAACASRRYATSSSGC